LTQAYGARFLVNDRVDLALASGADGVHVGQEDLPVPVVRELMGRDAIIGLSTHDRQQFKLALTMDLDYIAIGPAYPTRSKDTGYHPLGEELIGELAELSDRPVVAIGGITPGNAERLWNRDVTSVAVISDIADHPDPGRRILEYLELRK
ncbi:MAG TPA: thiamine phosphate synthase, partial [Acidobacteriota bacterium]|nr:thiamine phosphate synthase [Acidobacteriota bacterium]